MVIKKMKKVKWLLEEDFSNDSTGLIEELKKQNIEYQLYKYKPFLQEEIELFRPGSCVVSYGSINFIREVSQNYWIPGAWLCDKKLRCSTYYNYLGKYLLNDEYVFATLAEFRRNKKFYFDILGIDDQIFVRPDSNLKVFSGRLLDYDEDPEDKIYDQLDPEEMIIVSYPKNILKEWRFIVCNKKVITGSQYHMNNKLSVSSNFEEYAKNLAEEIAKTWSPEKVFVIDIGQTKYSYGLLEIGSFNCAGLYNCDKSAIVREVSKAAEDEYNEFMM